MTDYRRYRLKGGTYFFTVNLAERKRNLLTEHIDALRDAFREIKQTHPFQIDAIVVLPDHLHTLCKNGTRSCNRASLAKLKGRYACYGCQPGMGPIAPHFGAQPY